MRNTEYYYEDDKIKCRISYYGKIHDILNGEVYDENNNKIIEFKFTSHYCSRLKLRAKKVNQINLVTDVLVEYILQYLYCNNNTRIMEKSGFIHVVEANLEKSNRITFITLFKLNKYNKELYKI